MPVTPGVIQPNINNRLCFEAEEYTTITPGVGGDWIDINQSDLDSYGMTGTLLGGGGIRAHPDEGNQWSTSGDPTAPVVTYTVNLPWSGHVRISIKGMAPDGAGNSCHVQFNGEWVGNQAVPTNAWSSATFDDVPAGIHTLRIQVREDGAVIDRIVITPTTLTILQLNSEPLSTRATETPTRIVRSFWH